MSDFDGGAAAPADSSSAPAPTPNVPITHDHAPEPRAVGSQTPVAEKPEASPAPEPKKEPVSIRDAIRAANEKLKAEADKADAAPKAEPKAEAKPAQAESKPQERPRGDHGHFAPKDGAQPRQEPAPPQAEQTQVQPQKAVFEAPARFSAEGKAAWDATPDHVKAETNRAIRELEAGHEKYREAHKEYEPIRPYLELARQHGTTVPAALNRYIALERSLASDPIKGLQDIASDMGFDLREVAERIVNQTPEQRTQGNLDQQSQNIQRLSQQVETLTRSLQQQQEQQRVSAVENDVSAFAKDSPRFDELANDIAFFLSTGRASDLKEAYDLAARLNPAPAGQALASQPQASAAALQPEPLNPAGKRSVSGAPTAGSNPPLKAGPVPSARDAIKQAMAAVGRP